MKYRHMYGVREFVSCREGLKWVTMGRRKVLTEYSNPSRVFCVIHYELKSLYVLAFLWCWTSRINTLKKYSERMLFMQGMKYRDMYGVREFVICRDCTRRENICFRCIRNSVTRAYIKSEEENINLIQFFIDLL